MLFLVLTKWLSVRVIYKPSHQDAFLHFQEPDGWVESNVNYIHNRNTSRRVSIRLRTPSFGRGTQVETEEVRKGFGQEEEGSYWPVVQCFRALELVPGLFHHKRVQARQVPGVEELVAPDAGSVDDEGGVAVDLGIGRREEEKKKY